ncbi:hypothetical protein ACHHYP_02680 [Achlya hypogyna]|uniref:Cyclic nucleotide-binding domain-containing protein n=1 Tax=Achlya hypogyna TaxID=1202772 RepID=A0A1V9Z5U5_ACHHY|nr:hypothetical protein ACHHYP_02680 [Achlya hypogyna]
MMSMLPVLPEPGAPLEGSPKKRLPQSVRNILLRSQLDSCPRSPRSRRLENGRDRPSTNMWSQVVRTSIQRKKREQSGNATNEDSTDAVPETVVAKPTKSLATLVKSSRIKQFVTKAVTKAPTDIEPSNAMRQWALPIHTTPTSGLEKEDNPDIDEPPFLTQRQDGEAARRKREINSTNHGRNLILDEACRAAFSKEAENRSHLDLQSLKTWFLKTKLKTCTDFEALQPLELTLLCRRMKLATYYPNEVVFKQGDEGDALYIIFSGSVEVRLSQKIGGEVVEVVVCELHKGDFFGERSLLRDEPRAATVVTKTMTELVSICREDYNVMLKQDQQDFIERGKTPAVAAATNNHDTYVRILRKKPNLRTKAEVATLTTYIETIKFFRALPKAFLRELCTVIELINVGTNTTIFREGEVGKLFYVIMSGAVDIKVNSVDRRGGKGQTKLINLSEGAHFGELALMKANGLRSATVVTTQPCELIIIAEHDYNNILRKLQKEDMSKRLELLDKIPMFQSVEWTNELLEEICYVLVEQRYPAGTVLYAQGDKALQMYFITRGECVLTRTIVDPKTQLKYPITVERLGPFNVLGDDSATGMNFNEVIYRADTATASTPVDALVLTKYDVFNRLSRGARETLWGHTHAHKRPMVVMDQLYKSIKWKTYKEELMSETLDNKRLARRLQHRPSPPLDPLTPPTQMTLLESNDLLLVANTVSAPSSAMTLPKYTMEYNPDISTQDRKHVMELALATEAAVDAARAAEGNPAEYLRYLRASGSFGSGRSPSSRLGEDKIKSIISEKGYFSEHFIFSVPPKPPVPRPPPSTTKKPTHLPGRVSRSTVAPDRAPVLVEFVPRFVVINLANQQLSPVAAHPAFRLAGMFATKEDAEQAAREMEEYESRHVFKGAKADVGYYTLVTGKYVVVPATPECLLSSYYCDQALHSIVDHHTDWNYWRATRAKHTTPPSARPATSDLVQGIIHDVCTHITEVPLARRPSSPTRPVSTPVPARSVHLHDIVDHHIPVEMRHGGSYACVSILVLPKSATEPVLAVHGCFNSETEAMAFAEHGKVQQLVDSAMLCVIPMFEWVYFDDAAEWCVSLRKTRDRHLAFDALKKQVASHHAHGVHAAPETPREVGAVSGRKYRTAQIPNWVREKEQAQKIHQLVCVHLGFRLPEAEKPAEDEGYTPKVVSVLDEKLDALSDILAAQRSRTAHLSLNKVQKIHKIGNMIKAKVALSKEATHQMPE